jgi:N-acetylneuraminate synthase
MKNCLIIAEVGVNHNGSFELAKQHVMRAAECGADVVKFQTFKAENLVTANAPKAEYQKLNLGAAGNQLEMLKSLELSRQEHFLLRDICSDLDVEFLSTPFDEEALEFLVREIEVDRIKIPSGEITNAPLLVAAGRSQKPVILSTGMSHLEEVRLALGALAFGMVAPESEKPSLAVFCKILKSDLGRDALARMVTVLHCTSEYPAPFSSINLNAMKTLRDEFNLPVGLSDHSQGIAVPIAAVALGALVIEKHVTLDRSLSGPDHKASLEFDEFEKMVTSIRQVSQALGEGKKVPSPEEIPNISVIRKSLVASRPINKGEEFGWHNLSFKRPGVGVSPFRVYELIGLKSDRSYGQDELIVW